MASVSMATESPKTTPSGRSPRCSRYVKTPVRSVAEQRQISTPPAGASIKPADGGKRRSGPSRYGTRSGGPRCPHFVEAPGAGTDKEKIQEDKAVDDCK